MTRTDETDPVVDRLDDGRGVHINDPIEPAQFKLFTGEPIQLSPADPGGFFFPVAEAVAFETETLIVPKLVTLHLRDPDGEFLATFDPSQGAELVEAGPRIVQVSTAPMTIYLETDGGMRIRRRDESVAVAFEERTTVRLGVRSFHESPAATIRVTDYPEDVMTAISYFGSALKTLSCERSFGTLRGHPPALERGDSLSIPDAIDPPASPVTIELPPRFEYVYPAAPLAFYLGATVEPGPEPRLRCDEVDRPLSGPDGFQATVHDLFQHLFFMDCVTRTEGFYRVDLHERNELERRLDEDVDFASLYDAPLAEQLRRYLEVPTDALEPIRPTWHLCTDVAPGVETIESLPYVVNELPLVRCPYVETSPPGCQTTETVDPQESAAAAAVAGDVDEFVRCPDGGEVAAAEGVPPLPENVFRPPDVPAIEHEWLGPGIPLGANKATPATYRRRHQRDPADGEYISIEIVCNDPAMEAEGVVEEYYGLRDLVQFEVSIQYGLARDELASVLASSTDLVHYIGHVDEAGFRCRDGSLDARSLDEVGCRAFLLNACTSYNQGQALIDAGGAGGVVTLSEVANSVATETGHTIARLLNSGFTLRSAMSIAHDQHSTGQQYIVVGDGSVQLVQNESGVPYKVELRRTPDSEDRFEFDHYTYPSSTFQPGAFTTVNINDTNTKYLSFGYTNTFSPSTDELSQFLALESAPVELENRLLWSDEFGYEDLRTVSGGTAVRRDRPGLR